MLGWELITLLLAASAAMLVGFSKTGMPGAAIPAVALMAEAFHPDTQLSVGAILPILLVGDLFALAYYRRHADWSRLIALFPFVLLGMIPGYYVLWKIEGESLGLLLGVLVLVLLIVQVARQYFGWESMSHRGWMMGTTGLLTGFGTTVGNAAGPIMSIYLVSQRMDKQEFLGTAAWFFFLVNCSKIPMFTALGMITPRTLALDAILLPVVMIGAIAGIYAAKWIPQRIFNFLVLSLAAIAAIRLIVA